MGTFVMDKNPTEVVRKFFRRSKALEVLKELDLSGKVALITGANAGIGFETARALALHNCEVIFGCRNDKLAQEAIQKIENEKSDANCKYLKLDLSTLRSTKNFCDEVTRHYTHIDYLILNAVLIPNSFTKSKDNIEMSFQVSHLSHFYLTLELSNLLNYGSRVIVVSSEWHKYSTQITDNWNESTFTPSYCEYRRLTAYMNNKLYNILFARELAKRWKQRGVAVFSVHPGNLIKTNIVNKWFMARMLFCIMKLMPFIKNQVSKFYK